MINQENLNKLYDLLINDDELTTKKLNECGFNSKDLTDLIENETLVRIKRGYYTFLKIDDLYDYGKQLVSAKEYDKSTACFEKCYQLDPNNAQICFQLFFRCVINNNYNKIFEYFDKFYNDNEFDNNYTNFYLYLLSMITELPEKHKKYAKFLKFEDISVDSNDNDAYEQNRIRTSALNQRFGLALKQLNDYGNQYGRLNIQNIIIKSLLKQAIAKQKMVKENIIKLINERKYKEIIEYLEYIQECHRLSFNDETILILVSDLVEIIDKEIIPQKQIFKTDKLYEAINGKNYELALSICKEHDEKNNIESNTNVIHILLEEIQNLITKKDKIEYLPNKEVERINIKINPSNENLKNDEIPSSNNFIDIINYLMKQDLDNAFRILKNYLKNINKEEYEFLIVDLIKISLIENDIAFIKPMTALTHITRENFEFNISEYIQDFYDSLSKNEFKKARIYIDIISKSNILENTSELVTKLEEILNGMDRQQKPEDKVKEKIVCKNEEKQFKKNNAINKKDENKEFIDSKLIELFENGIVVLKPMDRERRKKIHDIINDIPDIVSFSIGTEPNRQVVLRFKPYIEGYVDVSKLSKEGKAAYKLGDYDLCINKFRQLLEFDEPKSWVYAQIGLAYLKKFNRPLAIDYLTVATYLSKNEKREYDFTELIEKLKGIKREERKPIFKMNIDEFSNDSVSDNYGIENIEEIATLISKGVTLDEICMKMQLSEEQKSIILLIYAREYYIQSNYKVGDRYLKEAEKIRSSSKYVKSLIEEIRKNKNFYKYKVDEEYKSLILKIQ